MYQVFVTTLQVYDGPSSTKLDSKPRHYATGYPEPKTRTGDEAIGNIIALISDYKKYYEYTVCRN